MRVRQVRQLSTVALFLCAFAALIRLWLVSTRSPHHSKQEATTETSPFELRDQDRERLRALKRSGGTKYYRASAYRRILRHGMWYVTTGPPPPPGGQNRSPVEISIYGAYIDTRDKKNLLIRAFGVSNSSSETPVRCLVWYLGFADAVMSNATVYDTGRGLYSNELSFQERMYACQPPENIEALPKLVAFTFEIDDVNPIPIVAPLPASDFQHDIGLCTAITYGYADPLWLVEWIEFNRLLGITEINFHVSNVSDEVTTVLAYYVRTGLVRVKPVAAPVTESCFWCMKLATIPILNDCMYRNMYRYRYLAVTDVDEIVVPRRHDSLRDLLRHLDVFYPSPAYIFSNVYFFLDFPLSSFQENGSATRPTTVPVLTTMTKLWRLKPSKRGYATKSLVNPRLCEVVQNHYCLRRTADVSKEYWATEVKHDLGLLHHYKKCHFELEECRRLLPSYFKDNSVEKFKDNLVFRVKETLANISVAIQSSRI